MELLLFIAIGLAAAWLSTMLDENGYQSFGSSSASIVGAVFAGLGAGSILDAQDLIWGQYLFSACGAIVVLFAVHFLKVKSTLATRENL